jgi:hypothetical protein
LLALGCSIIPLIARADTRIYTLDPAQSSITLSGTVTSQFGTAPIEQQGPGSLTTSYTGTIHADRSSSTIQFLSGGAIDANVSGNWQPLADASAGSAPADYGARVVFTIIVVNFAGRDLAADLTGAITPVDGSGNFDLANSTVNFTSGSIAYRANFGLTPGVESLAGNSGNLAGTATLTTEGAFEKLLLPVDATFNIPIDATTSANLTLDGQLIAFAPLPEELPGDFNQDGSVDAADYVAWQKGAGVDTTEENYNLWRTNFGRTFGGAGFAVPEPASILLGLGALSLFAAIQGNRRPNT